VLGAGAALAARGNLASVSYIRPQLGRVFIIDIFNFITAEETYFAFGDILAPDWSMSSSIS
jgi:hypothetical protein